MFSFCVEQKETKSPQLDKILKNATQTAPDQTNSFGASSNSNIV